LEGGQPKAVPFFIDMTKLSEQIKALVEAEAATLGAFVVGKSSGEQGLYRYYVDSPETLSLNTLAEITRKVSKAIDEGDFGDDAFTFEVSSPGADRPLTDIRQFAKHAGRTFEIATDDDKFEGKLLEANGNILSFEKQRTEKIQGKKQLITETLDLPFETIKTATIKISFK
jgi:ribosome maturation factor RimP